MLSGLTFGGCGPISRWKVKVLRQRWLDSDRSVAARSLARRQLVCLPFQGDEEIVRHRSTGHRGGGALVPFTERSYR